MTKKQHWETGWLVEIEYRPGKFNYAILLKRPMMAFLNVSEGVPKVPANPEEIPVLFKVEVFPYLVTSGVWKKVVKVDLEKIDTAEPLRFTQDTLTGKFYLYHSDYSSSAFRKPASFEEVQYLESASVWDDVHIYDRLAAQFEGKTDQWTESLRAKRPKKK